MNEVIVYLIIAALVASPFIAGFVAGYLYPKKNRTYVKSSPQEGKPPLFTPGVLLILVSVAIFCAMVC